VLLRSSLEAAPTGAAVAILLGHRLLGAVVRAGPSAFHKTLLETPRLSTRRRCNHLSSSPPQGVAAECIWWRGAGLHFLLLFLNFRKVSVPEVAQSWQAPAGSAALDFSGSFISKIAGLGLEAQWKS